MKAKAVIFDLDNTLIDRTASIKILAKKFHINYIKELFSEDQLFTVILEADNGGYRSKEEVFTRLKAKLDWKREVSFQEFCNFWYITLPESSVLMEDAVSVLSELRSRGFSIGMITNGREESQNAKINAVGIRDYFHSILISGMIGVDKPKAEIFEYALDKLGIQAGEAYYVGDHPVNDVYGAWSVGMKAIWFEGFHTWNDELGIKEFRKITKLKELPIMLTGAVGQPL